MRQYREGVESAWVDRKLQANEVQRLRDLANDELRLSPGTAADIEREVMGDTIEKILERQEAARQEHRNRRLEELYTQARRLHRDRKWQAVIDLFEQINSEDPNYPDPERLLASSREALEQERRVATLYDRGQRHMKADEWQKALECFEEVQRLKSGYRDTEEMLSLVRRELAPHPTVEVPELTGQRVSQARSSLANKGLELSAHREVSSDTIPEGEIIGQSPEPGKEVVAGSPVTITVSSGPRKVIATDSPDDQTAEHTDRPEPAQRLLPALAGSWWALALRGLVMGVFGLVLLTVFQHGGGDFRLYAALLIIADGVLVTIDATRRAGRRRLLLIQGRISGLVGLVTLLIWFAATINPQITEYVPVVYLVGTRAVFIGTIHVIVAFKLRWETRNLLLMGTSGVLLIISGILLWRPSFSSWQLLGFLALASGITLIAVALRVRGRE